jgi:hypothetical protein
VAREPSLLHRSERLTEFFGKVSAARQRAHLLH